MKSQQHKAPKGRGKQTGTPCPRCGERYPYVVRKGVEYCSHCHQPLPGSARLLTLVAWMYVEAASRVPAKAVA